MGVRCVVISGWMHPSFEGWLEPDRRNPDEFAGWMHPSFEGWLEQKRRESVDPAGWMHPSFEGVARTSSRRRPPRVALDAPFV